MSIYALTLGCPDLPKVAQIPGLPKVARPTIFSHNVDYVPQGNTLLP